MRKVKQATAVLSPLVKLQKDGVVRSIVHAARATAALNLDGSVLAWGDALDGGNSSNVQDQLADVHSICSTKCAFAALLADGSVVAWGSSRYGADCSKVQEQLTTNVQSICSTDVAFAAVKIDGSVVT